ncbi:hypothetical protein [Paenibacillus nuruki]|uniref:hypothetical protein n=1 Tax=Paenibacillus nuruki TaxID=1886670 RepID=UPI00280418A5|nr:hypothetical protein [Paenibacillus nuruki]CAJ1315917.1 Structural protein [Paenibacillus nuruki]
MEFNSVDVKEELLQFLKRSFTTAKVKIGIVKSDPQNHGDIPCIGINRVADSQSMHTLGDFGGSEFNEEEFQYTEIYSTYFQESMEVRIWHTNADEREKVYRLLKALLMVFSKYIVGLGVRSFTMEGGKDESDFSSQIVPFPVYWASIIISYANPLDVDITEHVQAITDITVNGGVSIGTK